MAKPQKTAVRGGSLSPALRDLEGQDFTSHSSGKKVSGLGRLLRDTGPSFEGGADACTVAGNLVRNGDIPTCSECRPYRVYP